jgi:hypothetical protein
MAFTQAQIDALDEAIATGVTRGRMSNGEEVEYRSLSDMRAVRKMMAEELAGSAGTTFGVIYPRASRGL